MQSQPEQTNFKNNPPKKIAGLCIECAFVKSCPTMTPLGFVKCAALKTFQYISVLYPMHCDRFIPDTAERVEIKRAYFAKLKAQNLPKTQKKL